MKIKGLKINQFLSTFAANFKRYRLMLFLGFLLVLYGFLAWQIQTLDSAQPTDDQVSAKLQSTNAPHVDSNVISKMQQLQDNSVNVQTLFDQARDNPFQE